MPSTVWKGSLVLGDLRIPIKLSNAASAESLSFNQLHAPDLSRVKQSLLCEVQDMPIPRSEIVTGFEFEKGRYVVISDEDIEAAKPKATRDTLELVQFVRAIDPTWLESHYHVEPDGNDETGYAALFAALKKTKLLGVGEIMMYRKESVAVIRAGRSGIILHKLYAASEVRHLSEFRTICPDTDEHKLLMLRMCKLMRKLVEEFDPEKFVDDFRVNLLATIAEKTAQLRKPASAEAAGEQSGGKAA